MTSSNGKKVLVSGASFAGLSTAYWLSKAGYGVTVVELAAAPRAGGAAINIQGEALAAAKRMGIFEHMKAHRLQMEQWEFKDADDVTVRLDNQAIPLADEAIEEVEIEREQLLAILLAALGNEVDFLFNNRITALSDTAQAIAVTFLDGTQGTFDLVFGCDGLHSGVRTSWFGPEKEYAQYLEHYFSLTIVNKSLIKQRTAQFHNVPGKSVMLNAYNQKTDIAFCFFSQDEIPYNYRDAEQQKALVAAQFAGLGWRTAELLEYVKNADISYFDKFCQIKMPAWTKGRVALVGDAAYCASPAAGIGASLAGAAAPAMADALAKHPDSFEAGFQEYEQAFRPFVEQVQATAVFMLTSTLVPATEEAIRARNERETLF